jgi:transcriptional regulator with XRE-family HTH domain
VIQEKRMSGFRKNLWDNLSKQAFRRAYVAENARTGIAYQIRALREARGWSQRDLAEKCGKPQSNIARFENPEYGNLSVKSLLEIANAFDVWLSVEFVSFRTGVARTANRSLQALDAASFNDEMREQAYATGVPATLASYDASNDFLLQAIRGLQKQSDGITAVATAAEGPFEHIPRPKEYEIPYKATIYSECSESPQVCQ